MVRGSLLLIFLVVSSAEANSLRPLNPSLLKPNWQRLLAASEKSTNEQPKDIKSRPEDASANTESDPDIGDFLRFGTLMLAPEFYFSSLHGSVLSNNTT